MSHMRINRRFLRTATRIGLKAVAKNVTAKKIIGTVAALGFALQPVAFASTITRTDGGVVTFNNGVADVFAGQVINNNVAINRFNTFQLDANNIANMYFGISKDSNGVANLVNFVDSRIDINGTVNAIQNNKIGGNLFFLSADGMAVGKTGIINAGALYVATPTVAAFGKYKNFSTTEQFNTILNDKSFAEIPINASGTISVLGKVNATNSVNLRAAKIGVGKNVDSKAIGDVAAGATAAEAAILTGVIDFSDVVNISNVKSGLKGDDLKAEKTGNGDIVLAAVNNISDNVNAFDYEQADDIKKILVTDNKAEALLEVAAKAKVTAAGDAILSATAINNIKPEQDENGGITYASYKTAATDGVLGQTAVTTATVNIDGSVSGRHVDIAANAVNRYVGTDMQQLTQIDNLAGAALNTLASAASPLNVDYAKLTSAAKVNIADNAVIEAKGADIKVAATADAAGENAAITPALNITAHSDIDIGIGASNSLMDKIIGIKFAGSNYAESSNSAEVSLNGSLSSVGSTNIAAQADSTISSTAAASSAVGIAGALNITKGENNSKICINNELTSLAGDVNINAASNNSVKTSAEAGSLTGSTSGIAVNVTQYNSNADVEINKSVSSSSGNIAVAAENVYTNNYVTASTSLGTRFGKIDQLMAEKNQALAKALGDLPLGSILTKINKSSAKGASAAIAKESNLATVKLGQGAGLAAKQDLTIAANSSIQDTNITASGKIYKYNEGGKTTAFNASVAYSSLDNDAAIIIAGTEQEDAAAVLTGVNVTLTANSSFAYSRIKTLIKDLKTAYSNIQIDSSSNEEVKNNAAAFKAAIDALDGKINNGGYADFEELLKSNEVTSLVAAANALERSLVTVTNNIKSVLDNALKFADPLSYVNFGASNKNSGNADSSFTGSAVVTELANNARVLVGQNTKLTTGTGALGLNASSTQYDISLAGSPLPSSAESAVGGTASYTDANFGSLVAVAKGASLSAGDIRLNAANNIDHIQIAVGAGKGSSSGIEGMAVYTNGSSNSIVSVDDEAVLSAAADEENAGTGSIAINAANATNIYSAAGVLAKGETAGVGAAVAIINFARNNYAAIADNGYVAQENAASVEIVDSNAEDGAQAQSADEDANADRSLNAAALKNAGNAKRSRLHALVQAASGLQANEQESFFGNAAASSSAGSITTGSLDVAANTSGQLVNATIAGSVATQSANNNSIIDKVTQKLNILDSKTESKNEGLAGKTSAATSSLPGSSDSSITFSGNTPKAGASVAVAGSASVNLLTVDTAAIIDNSKINIANNAAANNVNVAAKDEAAIVAAGGAGAVAWKKLGTGSAVGIAGVAAVNDVDRATYAQISNSVVDGADAIINSAKNSGVVVAAGVGMAVSKSEQSSAANSVNTSVNMADNTVYALLENNKVNKETVSGVDERATSITNTAFDNDIQITGGISGSIAYSATNNAEAGGATVVYSELANDVQAVMLGGTYDKITTADVRTTTNITQVGVAGNVGIAGGTGTTYAFSGNCAYNKLDNYANAVVEGVTMSGQSLNVAAYDTANSANAQTAYLKERGFDADGSAYLTQVKEAADESGDTDEGKTTDIDINRKGNVIVTGAVSVGVTTGNSGGSAAASVSVSDIDNDYNAQIKDSVITTTGIGDGDALAGIKVKADSNTILAGFAAGIAGTNGKFGIGGSANWQSMNNDVTAGVENSSLSTPKTDIEAVSGALAVNIAGQLDVTTGAASKLGAGLAVAYNSLNNNTSAYVKGSEISGIGEASSVLLMDAANMGKVYSIGAAVGAGTANALNGVVVVNRGRNDVEAVIDSYDGDNKKTADGRSKLNNMHSISVKSSDASNQLAVVGAVSVSAGTNAKFAAGGSIAYNEIGNITGGAGRTKQINRAAINNADITTNNNGKISVNAVDEAALTTISVGTAISTGKVSFSGAGSAATIKKDTTAELVNTNINKDRANAGAVQAAASGEGRISTVAVVAAGAKDAAIGAGIAVNQLDADTSAIVSGGEYQVQGLTAKSVSESSILSVGVAGGVAKTAGLAGNIGVNLLANDTIAKIDTAKINAGGTIGVIAKSKDSLQNFAGSFGVAAGGQAGIGMGVAYNEISGTTASIVNDATLTAAGNDAGLAVTGRDKDNEAAADIIRRGVVIAADAEHQLTNVAVSAGVAVSSDIGVGVAGTITVNRILGATNAKAVAVSINEGLSDSNKADVYVAAADVTASESHVGSLGVGGGATGGAGAGLASDTGVVSRSVTALIDGGSTKKFVNANELRVAALNKAAMSTNAYGIAGAGGAVGAGAGAGTVSVTKLDAETTAAVKNINSTNNGLTITAAHINDIVLRSSAAAASGALASGAGGAGIGVVDDDSKTTAELSGSRVNTAAGDIAVNAANETNVQTAVYGVAASMVAGGLNVAVNNLDNTVSTLVKDNSSLKAANTFSAHADNAINTEFVNGADAAGAGAIAVGVGVNTLDTGVVTEISGSTISAAAINVAANEKLDLHQAVQNAALGAQGYSANVSITAVGAAAADSYGDSETTDTNNKASFDTDAVIDMVNNTIDGQGNVGTVTDGEGEAKANTAGLTFAKYSGVGGQSLSAASGSAADKGSSNAAGVQAKVSNSTLQAAGNTAINAKRTVDAEITSAQVAAGLSGNGIAASVAVLDVERKTGVSISNNSKISGKDVNIASTQDGTANINAYQAAVGAGFGGSAAYAQNSLHGTNAVAIDNSTIQANGDISAAGTLSVKAADSSAAAVHTIGATAGALAGGVLVSNATNDSDNTITIGGSMLIAAATEAEAKTSAISNLGRVDVAAASANAISAQTYGGMVGVAAAQGIVALAADAGNSSISVTGSSGFVGSGVSLAATAKPAVQAQAQAYSGGLLAVAGVAVAKAETGGSVSTTVADGSSFVADAVDIAAGVTTQTGRDKDNQEYAIDNVSAKTIGATASGAYAAGFNAAYAENAMTVTVGMGKAAYSVGSLNLKADNASVISADSLGVTVGGYIASGSNLSDTKTSLTTKVTAAGVSDSSANLGDVSISSLGYAAVNNKANGYGGGIVGFNPVAARSQNDITTDSGVDISGTWDSSGTMSVAAANADRLNLTADSLTAAVLGASGTEIINDINHAAVINVTGNVTSGGKQAYIASNSVNHDVDLKGSGYGGGSINANVIDNSLSYTAGVNFDQATLSASGKEGSIEAFAYTYGRMDYQNTLKAAGVVAGTVAASNNNLIYNNSIKLNDSNLYTAKPDQDITLAATDETTATFDTTADTQGGAVGAASAVTDNQMKRSNLISVSGGKILSTNDVNIYAGANLDGITSSLIYNVLADAYNKTTLPLATVPKAKNKMEQYNQVNIGGDIDSVRHTNLKAGKGTTTVSISAREYNLYTGTSGSGSVTSTALGQVSPSETTDNYINIDSGSKVRAGIHNKLDVNISGSTKVTAPEFDANGQVIAGKEGSLDYSDIKIACSDGQEWFNAEQNITTGEVELQNGLCARLQEINILLGAYASDSDEYSILNSERERIITQMEENGFVRTTKDENNKTYKTVFETISLPAINVNDIVISGGDINIETDSLQGDGSLTAQSAENLSINNSSDLYLKLNDLVIKDKGGVIRYNDDEISNDTSQGTDPKITVVSTGSSDNGLTNADIGIFGTVQNSTGDILVQNSNYNINLDGNANISARNIELKADKGSVTQSSDGLLLIGGDPVTKYQFSNTIAKKIQKYVSEQAINGSTTISWLSNINSYEDYKAALVAHKDDLGLSDTEVNEINNYTVNKSGGIVAGNNIYISGLNVNLDGLVQSGYKEYRVVLDAAANNKIKSLDDDYKQKQTVLTNQYVMSDERYCVSSNAGAVYNEKTNSYDYTVKVYYNPATQELLTEAIEPNGGKIYLTGAVSSTGSGRLLAMDGTANINIDTKAADRALRVNKIVNKDITGLISIKDTQKNTLTEYTTNGSKLSVKTTTLNNKGNVSSSTTKELDGSSTQYNPAENMTINWTGGTSGDKKVTQWKYEKDFIAWSLIKYNTTDDFVNQEEVKTGKEQVSTSSISSNDPLGQGTVINVNNNAKEYSVTTKNFNDPNATNRTPVVENKQYAGLKGKIFGYGKCVYSWTETSTHSTSSTYTIKGDKPIAIGFMTGGSGDISVSGAKDMYIAGNITNAANVDGSAIGKVSLSSTGGAISSMGNARIYADDLTASAAKGVSLNHAALGQQAKLDIQSATGSVGISSDRGSLLFIGGSRGALGGNLAVNAAGDITTASGTILSGSLIDLDSKGGINAVIAPEQTPSSSDTMSASVNARAYGDITLTNNNGDMRLGHIVSQTGDVSLTTSGSFIDAVGDSTLSGSEDKLAKWQELGLVSEADADDKSDASAEAAKNERLQALENRAGQLAMADKKYTKNEQSAALAEYKQLAEAYKTDGENVFDGKNYSNDVKEWVRSYAALDASTAYGWSRNELLYAIQRDVLNAEPGQILTVDTANIQGKNISLSAGKGIGIDGETKTIAYGEMSKLDNLKLLAQAKAGDLTWMDEQNKIAVRQQRQITVQMAEGGKLKLEANTNSVADSGNVYLAGVKDTLLDISGTISTSQDVKLLSDKGVRMDDGSISAKNLIIQGGNGDIGSTTNYITTNISGNLSANTDTDYGVYIHQAAAGSEAAKVLTLEAVATGSLKLKADQGMQMTTEAGKTAGYINAEDIELQAAAGDIGKENDGIRILENGAKVNAKTDNGSVYLQGEGTNGSLIADSIIAQGNVKLNANGDVSMGRAEAQTGFALIAGLDITITDGYIKAAGDATLNAQTDATLNGAELASIKGATVLAAGGNISLGTSGSRITAGGAATISAGGNVSLGANNIIANANSAITAAGGNIALGSSCIIVGSTDNSLKLDAAGYVMQDADAAGIEVDNLIVVSGKSQQLLSPNNKVKSLTIQGKGEESMLVVDGLTRFNGTTDNLQVKIADSHVNGDVLIENHQADTGKVTINSSINTSKYDEEHSGNITIKADSDISSATGVELIAADKLKITSKYGSVTTGGNVSAVNGIAYIAKGDITANGAINSANADVNLQSENGSITTAKDVKAEANVTYNAKGSIATGSISSTVGNILLQTNSGAGNISMGGDVTADHGNININVLQNGNVVATANKLIANGDKGSADSGNLTLFVKGAGNASLNRVYATNNALIDVADGNLTLAEIDGDLVALQLRTQDKQLHADKITAGTKILAQGSSIDLKKIQQRLDAAGLLTIIPDGTSSDKPIAELTIGEITTNKGVCFEHLWMDNGSINVSEGQFLINKLVVNDVAHFSNKHMVTAVWGAAPQRDGSDSVFWNNTALNNPADNQKAWQQAGAAPDQWMYLYFTAQPDIQRSNGALLDLRNYDYVYDQRFTAVNHLLQQLDEYDAKAYKLNYDSKVVPYFRYDLYDLEELPEDEDQAQITVEA